MFFRFLQNLRAYAYPNHWLIFVLAAALLLVMGMPGSSMGTVIGLMALAAVSTGVVIYNLRVLTVLVAAIEKVGHLPVRLIHDKKLLDYFTQIAEQVIHISTLRDQCFQGLAEQRIQRIIDQLSQLADGTVVFSEPDSWRPVYEELLRGPLVHHYRSVAWVRSADYWTNLPASKNMLLNYDLSLAGKLRIERIMIVSDWVMDDPLLANPGRFWSELSRQMDSGIDIFLVRESSVPSGSPLLCDIGIYGTHACGEEKGGELENSATFLFHFNHQKVAEFENRWQCLKGYSIHFNDFSFNRP